MVASSSSCLLYGSVIVIGVGVPNQVVVIALTGAHDRAQHLGERIVGGLVVYNHPGGAQNIEWFFGKPVPSAVSNRNRWSSPAEPRGAFSCDTIVTFIALEISTLAC